jgi:UDP-N-acetylmuramoyl-tripeptide--D-alanyl-D-alanine ligase
MFKVEELLKATKGRLISGESDTIIKGISIDTRTIKLHEAFMAIKGANFDGHHFINEALKKGAKAVIVQAQNQKFTKSQIKIPFIEVKDTVRALGDIAKFQREKFNIPVIAVTGSNGKTTTKEMIKQVLSKKFKVLKNIGTKNNQIGLPLTLLDLTHSYDLAVLEVGSNHFGEVDYLSRICQPNIGIITNIGHSHIEYFKNLAGVFREKYTLIKGLKNPRIAILNSDDILLRRNIDKINKSQFILGFGIKNRCDFFASQINKFSDRVKFLVNQKYRFTLKTLGYYNIYNALAAIAVARIFGIAYEDIALRLASFDFPQSRLQLLRLHNSKFINDTYNSNPLSLKQALDTLDNFNICGRKILVMGDMLELGSKAIIFHRQIGQQAARICDIFITVGKLSRYAADTAMSRGLDRRSIFVCENNIQARGILFGKVCPGPDDVILVKGSRAMMMEEIFKKPKVKCKKVKEQVKI